MLTSSLFTFIMSVNLIKYLIDSNCTLNSIYKVVLVLSNYIKLF